jgi:hypothetical protein
MYGAPMGSKVKIMLWLPMKVGSTKMSPQTAASGLCCSTVVFEATHWCGKLQQVKKKRWTSQ